MDNDVDFSISHGEPYLQLILVQLCGSQCVFSSQGVKIVHR